MASKKVGSAGRFGPRYGGTLRKKVSDIEASSRKKFKSPFSGRDKSVKRVSYGIWECRHTGKKFIGKAYKPQ